MTHTYSRGCFKLIFRKCLPIYTPCCTHTHANVQPVFITISPAFSRFRTVKRYRKLRTHKLFPLFIVFLDLWVPSLSPLTRSLLLPPSVFSHTIPPPPSPPTLACLRVFRILSLFINVSLLFFLSRYFFPSLLCDFLCYLYIFILISRSTLLYSRYTVLVVVFLVYLHLLFCIILISSN